MSDRGTRTLSGSDDRWRNLEELGRAAGGRQPRGPKGPRSSRRRRVLVRTLAIGLAVVAVLGTVGAFLGYRYADKLVGRGQRRVANLSPIGSGQPMNILLVGSDSRDGLSRQQLGRIQTSKVDGRRTDTIIILHVSPRQQKAVMVSIPRDLRATIDGRTNRINAAFSLGGPDLLVKTVEQTTGLPINHYAEIDFAGFLKVVDAVGGVRLCNDTGHELNDSFANLHMAPGCRNMSGVQALAFVRARHIDSDFGRIGRQQQFLRAVMSKVSSKGNLLNLPKLASIGNIVSDHVKTDDTLETSEAVSLLRRLGKLDSSSVDMRLYPSFDGGIDPSDGVDYVRAAPEAPLLMKAIVDDAQQLPPIGLTGGKGVSLRDVRLVVLNGSGANGAAARAADGLRQYGLRVVQTGNATKPTGDASTLTYPPALEQQAKLLSFVLGKQVKLVRAGAGQATGSSALVLTVGSSYQVVAPPG